jgi:DNA-binding transcriptional LysR family regulator
VLTNIDLRLLAIISELHKTRSVSQTAENLGLSQSGVSMNLAKLRKHFNDPLFVRTSAGMEPTPYAVELISELKRAEDILQSALDRRAVFTPGTSERTFRLCSTDIAEFTILPTLIMRLRKLAPQVRIDLRPIDSDTPRLLESGGADLAIGLIPPMGAGFVQQKLFQGRFACAVRADHPRVKDHITRELFQTEMHLVVTTTGTGYQMLEKILETEKLHRTVGLRIPSFLGVAGIISVTDYIVIITERLGRILAEGKNMKILPLPFHVPPYTVTQNWHERYNLEPAHQWLRGLLAGLYKDISQASRKRPGA